MYNFEDSRRKNHFGNTLKNGFGSHSHNNLVSNIDKKHSDYSNDKDKIKKNHIPEVNDLNHLKESATINFRQLQNKQNIQNTQKLNKNFVQPKMSKKPSIQETNGMQIHVNIQNAISQKKILLNEVHSDRELSQRKKQDQKIHLKVKKPLKNQTISNQIQNFQCDQQLEIKLQKKTEKKITLQKIQKNNIQNNHHPPANSFIHPTIQIPQIQPMAPVSQINQKNKFNQKHVPQKQIAEFEGKQLQINNMSQALSICYLDSRQIHYEIDPLYIEKKQKNFTWLMRASLMEWMMHVSYEFMLKRQTLHIAITIVDNFFQTTTNLTKSDFQLSGAAALFIAAKLEQFQPLSSKEFAKSTSNRFNAEQIREMQIKICKTLKYNLNPPTINMWANKIMQQWDLFIDNDAQSAVDYFKNNSPIYFKKLDDQSYKNYREIMQILDCTILDIQTVQYKPKILVCSLLYLFLGKQFKQFTKKRIVTELPRTSRFFLQETDFNSLFKMFLEESFGIKMFELLPSVQYLATYFILHLNFDRPCLPNQDQDIQRMNLQQYSSFQTYNPNMLVTVKKRFRGIYQ